MMNRSLDKWLENTQERPTQAADTDFTFVGIDLVMEARVA